ncbi:glutaredoxin [Psychromonas sp. RZ22]|uniref:glutathione S-transferase N-terminal domain-containing protein n=1 Tax=Psychromonas algarum TaxID=2555643 RepID=UPI0010680BFA|nr:glutathione S-transferase N-terminal domain-containing protein [Psychromonas sp. RZ22]TEW53996.1 glutaredoxin [Psychromonas sp. RZ22]
MKIIRWLLGRLILILNFIFAPKKLKRDADLQQKIDQETQNLQLFQYQACPFCVKVRRAIRRQSLHIKLVDAKQENNRKQLSELGGQVKVPCLRIEENNEVTWMYESSDIIKYLENKFS